MIVRGFEFSVEFDLAGDGVARIFENRTGKVIVECGSTIDDPKTGRQLDLRRGVFDDWLVLERFIELALADAPVPTRRRFLRFR